MLAEDRPSVVLPSRRRAPDEILVLVKGAGDLGTGVACRLHRAGMQVLNAVYEVGVRLERLPATAEKLRSALKSRRFQVVLAGEK